MKVVCDCGKEHEVETKEKKKNKTLLMDSAMVVGFGYCESDDPREGLAKSKDLEFYPPVISEQLDIVGGHKMGTYFQYEYLEFKGCKQGVQFKTEYLNKIRNIAEELGYDIESLQYYLPKGEHPLAVRICKNWFALLAPRLDPDRLSEKVKAI